MLSTVSPGRSLRAKWSSWPPQIADYLQKWILDHHSPAFITSRAGRVVAKGGDLARYGIENVHEGDSVTELAYFLEGLLPLDGSVSHLSRVETAAGTFADIHLFRAKDLDCVVLLDGSREVAELTETEQALRQAEEHLRRAEKMEALGRLAGGVAHDFNNLLTVILGYAHVLADNAPQQKSSAAHEIIQAANRAAAMTRQLLSFSRRQVRQVETLDLNAIVSQLQDPLHRLIGEDIDLVVELEASLGFVEADRGQMEQILVNLAVNARDAMPAGGLLKICTGNLCVDGPYAEGRIIPQGSYVRLMVSDNGCGMDAETRARAFEPFFTSKESGQGTGLGLSIVYGIVNQSGGEIILESEVGRGTRFEILLPAVDRAPAAGADPSGESLARGTETILVVEDEDAVRKLLCSILTRLGYSVLESAEASAAMELSRLRKTKIDLLVTDLVMPEMNGPNLAAHIVAGHPETRVLYVSGYTREYFATRGITLPGDALLPKPFTPGLLAARVREVLTRPPRRTRKTSARTASPAPTPRRPA
jgi:signal transduction histidine kinase/ActR/RegA family two-component response regulator